MRVEMETKVKELYEELKEEQKWFLEQVINSPDITFIEGGPYKTSK